MSTAYRDALEAEHARDVDAERETVRAALDDIATEARAIERALRRLGDGPGNLFDVELEGERMDDARLALAQVRVAVAALGAIVPKPGA